MTFDLITISSCLSKVSQFRTYGHDIGSPTRTDCSYASSGGYFEAGNPNNYPVRDYYLRILCT